MKKLLLLILLIYSSALLSAQPLTVYSSNYPLHYFSQRIGGDLIRSMYIIPKEIDPAFWQPSSSDIQTLQQADLIVLNGANYEKWLPKVSLPRRKLINTSRSFQADYLYVKNTSTHNHGYDGAHSHQGTAFTTWMDPSQAILQANAIKKALSQKRPVHAQRFEKNFLSLRQDLESLDKDWMHLLQTLRDETLLASHPVYHYLERRYQLSIHSMQWEPDVYPDENQWQSLSQLVKQMPLKWMLWEDQPLEKTRARLNALGISPIVFSPAGNQADWLEIMQQNTRALEQITK